MEEKSLPQVIFDTDMETDCDDAGALAMLCHAHRAGAIRLLGAVADAPGRYVAPCCEAICKYYGLDVPVGAVYEAEFSADPRFADYRAHCARMTERHFYNRKLALPLGKRDTDYPRAEKCYRKLLSEAQDQSVTIVCVGFLTALAALLKTEGDEISPLTGVELMEKKVCRVVSMGDAPYGKVRPVNFNYHMDQQATEDFFSLCPVPVYVCPEGTEVITGHTLSSRTEEGHPVRVAYESFTGAPHRGRSSWDLLAVLYAISPDTPYLAAQEHGTIGFLKENPRVFWQEDGKRRDALISLNKSAEEVSEYLEERLYTYP